MGHHLKLQAKIDKIHNLHLQQIVNKSISDWQIILRIFNNFDGIEFSYDLRVESAHHRKEKRQIWAVSIEQMGGLYKQSQWSGLQTKEVSALSALRIGWDGLNRPNPITVKCLAYIAKS